MAKVMLLIAVVSVTFAIVSPQPSGLRDSSFPTPTKAMNTLKPTTGPPVRFNTLDGQVGAEVPPQFQSKQIDRSAPEEDMDTAESSYRGYGYGGGYYPGYGGGSRPGYGPGFRPGYVGINGPGYGPRFPSYGGYWSGGFSGFPTRPFYIG